MAAGATGKVLGPARVRGLGDSTLAALQCGLGFTVTVTVTMDDAAFEAARDRNARQGIEPRQRNTSYIAATHRVGKMALRRALLELSRRGLAAQLAGGPQAQIARQGGRARAEKLSPERRAQIAREAGRASGLARQRQRLALATEKKAA